MSAPKELRCATCQKVFACRRISSVVRRFPPNSNAVNLYGSQDCHSTHQRCQQVDYMILKYLVKHTARVHTTEKEEKKPLNCAICRKSFPRLSHLQRHTLIHIKLREWGCPFCEQTFVQKVEYLMYKFKPHLVRHIGRRHSSERHEGLSKKIAANKWRTEGQPIDVGNCEDAGKSTSIPEHCAGLVPRLLCAHCGATFDNRTDLCRHVTRTHRSVCCNQCGKTFEGLAQLRSHERRQREHAHECSCGATFKRFAELRFHEDSCRIRGSFLCLACDTIFTQRTQLDRHWKKEHFKNAQCAQCGWTAAAPLRKAEHALKVHKRIVCGYCGEDEPSKDHISIEHWKRLRKSVPIQKTTKKRIVGGKSQLEKSFDDVSESLSAIEQNLVGQHNTEVSPLCEVSTSDSEPEGQLRPTEEISDVVYEELQSSNLDISTKAPEPGERYINVVLSVPDNVVDVFFFGDRLPAEVVELFPELANARVCMVEPFTGQKRFLSLHIPVSRPSEANAETERLLSVPIYV